MRPAGNDRVRDAHLARVQVSGHGGYDDEDDEEEDDEEVMEHGHQATKKQVDVRRRAAEMTLLTIFDSSEPF